MLRTAVLSGVAALVIAVDWLRFEDPRSGGGRPFVLVLLAIAPALVRPWWARVAAVAVSVFVAACIAFSVAPLHPTSAPGRFKRGFLDFYDFRIPFDPHQNVRMHEVVLFAIFGFTLAVALSIAARRAVLAVVAFLVGAGWPATLLAGGNELGRGVFILAVALLLLAGLTERPSRLALGAGVVVVFGALALSSSAAVTKGAFLGWQHWDFYNRPQKPVSVRYVWDANYDGLRFPKKVTTVLSIRAPRTPVYWRATVLDSFDGIRWREHLWDDTAGNLLPRKVDDRRDWIRQDVTVRALDDNHLVGASIPVAYNVSEPAVVKGQGVVKLVDGLHRDQRYTIWSYAARPTPAQLVRVPAVYPRALTAPGHELELAGRVNAPPFSAPGREQRMFSLLTGRLQPYAELYDRARAVAGQTRSPYAAAVALERWFRVTGGFTYSEEPGATPGLPPLVGFVVDTRTGYCQHFAGAMAFMLRLLGIPARVAAGFVPGHYQDGTWTVTDHDAHTWVEVWFEHYGWLAFDPTPGRGRLTGSYSSTSVGFDPSAAAKLLAGVVRGGEVFGSGGVPAIIGHDDRIRTPRSAADVPVRGLHAPPPAPAGSSPSLVLFLFLLAAGVAATIVVLKLGRRKLRYLTRDPRRVASACALELAEFLQDQRVTPSRASTLHELGATISDRFGVDAGPFAQAATTARYGPRAEAGSAARRARTELREVKRKLRRGLFVLDRARGLISVRSLGLG